MQEDRCQSGSRAPHLAEDNSFEQSGATRRRSGTIPSDGPLALRNKLDDARCSRSLLHPFSSGGAGPVLFEWSRSQRSRCFALRANLTGLPPIRVHVGDDEVLLDDSVRFVDRALAAGVDAQLDVWEGMAHGFPGSVGLLNASHLGIN
jgi:acetyl esterase/lipase